MDNKSAFPVIDMELVFLALVLHYGRTNFRKNELGQFFFQSDEIAENCIAAGWLTPKVEGNRLAGFDLADIVACLSRLNQEGRPPKA